MKVSLLSIFVFACQVAQASSFEVSGKTVRVLQFLLQQVGGRVRAMFSLWAESDLAICFVSAAWGLKIAFGRRPEVGLLECVPVVVGPFGFDADGKEVARGCDFVVVADAVAAASAAAARSDSAAGGASAAGEPPLGVARQVAKEPAATEEGEG